MDLNRMKNASKLDLCRKYYFGGFVCLPFLWFINAAWFFREAFIKPAYPQQAQIKQCDLCDSDQIGLSRGLLDVIRSAIGAVLWLGVITTWVVIFQVNRASWGAAADYMSFIIPKGIP